MAKQDPKSKYNNRWFVRISLRYSIISSMNLWQEPKINNLCFEIVLLF